MKNWELVNFCEFDKYAVKSYCAIHDETEEKNLGDITKLDETKLKEFNMICGGSPCQDFSIAGKQKGSMWICKECRHKYNPITQHYSKRDCCPNCGSKELDKSRSSLLVEWLRVIRTNKPNWGIYENVKNITNGKHKQTFDLFIKELEEYGYNTYWKILNAKNYGIPQNRERVYLFIVKKELDNRKFEFPKSFDNGLKLKDMLENNVDEKFYLNQKKLKLFQRDFGSKGKILNIDVDYSPTLTASMGTGGGNMPCIKNKCFIRKLTPKECWRLMGFKDQDIDNCIKAGVSNSQLYKQAENSIVVNVLYEIYKEIYKAMPYLFDDLKVGSYFSGIGAFEKALDKLYEDINNNVNFTKPQTD